MHVLFNLIKTSVIVLKKRDQSVLKKKDSWNIEKNQSELTSKVKFSEPVLASPAVSCRKSGNI